MGWVVGARANRSRRYEGESRRFERPFISVLGQFEAFTRGGQNSWGQKASIAVTSRVLRFTHARCFYSVRASFASKTASCSSLAPCIDRFSYSLFSPFTAAVPLIGHPSAVFKGTIARLLSQPAGISLRFYEFAYFVLPSREVHVDGE